MPIVAIVYYSAQGHTHEVAEAVAKGIRGVNGTVAELVRLQDADIQNGRYSNVETLRILTDADGIVFGTPTYMGGYSAQMKAFIDACSGLWFQQSWKDKLAAGFTHSQGLSGDKLNTLNGLYINAMQHGMVWVGTGILPAGSKPEQLNRIACYSGLMAQSDPDQPSIGEGDKETAVAFGKRIAETLARWMVGTKPTKPGHG